MVQGLGNVGGWLSDLLWVWLVDHDLSFIGWLGGIGGVVGGVGDGIMGS